MMIPKVQIVSILEKMDKVSPKEDSTSISTTKLQKSSGAPKCRFPKYKSLLVTMPFLLFFVQVQVLLQVHGAWVPVYCIYSTSLVPHILYTFIDLKCIYEKIDGNIIKFSNFDLICSIFNK